ncbi:12148_t:CDS:2 [Ambispora gerdemannii]|uniref:12148_t:CDS:1 n=1 Tax=Ambispora gerdemannii TaxID=144530 RepID=A0A9N8V0M8_9GLOM|nr:12148_t:CDS:2 [Ambispora gerdemannii]
MLAEQPETNSTNNTGYPQINGNGLHSQGHELIHYPTICGHISQPNVRTSYVHPKFTSRPEAGKLLAKLLRYYANHDNTVVFSIKPEATLLAHEIAKDLNLPLDLFIIRLLQIGGLTYGAISNRSPEVMLKNQIVRDISQETIDNLVAQERIELQNLINKYSPNQTPIPTGECATIILVTDGIQTGQNARAAITILKSMLGYDGKIILVAGVIGSDAQKTFKHEVDDVVSLKGPQIVGTVASWYQNNEQASDEEIKSILQT